MKTKLACFSFLSVAAVTILSFQNCAEGSKSVSANKAPVGGSTESPSTVPQPTTESGAQPPGTQPPVTQPGTQLPPAGNVIGFVEGVQKAGDGRVTIRGWACVENYNASIGVHLYVGGPAGSPGAVRIISDVPGNDTANRPSEPAVSAACRTESNLHRYEITVSKLVAEQNANKPIYVHGLHPDPSGMRNLTLKNLGDQLKYLPLPEGDVIGYVDKAELLPNDNVKISGWACVKGYNASIGVHLYLGGSAGSPGAVRFEGAVPGSETANLPSEVAVSAACGTNLNNHRYEIVIPSNLASGIMFQKIYVHGLHPDPSGMRNPTIANGSGQLFIPPPSTFILNW